MQAIEPILDTLDIQGNIAPGFNLPHQLFIGFCGDTHSIVAVLDYLSNKITSMQKTFEFHEERKNIAKIHNQFGLKSYSLMSQQSFTWFNVALGYKFLNKIGIDSSIMKHTPFRIGMYERSYLLGDTKDSNDKGHRKNWKFGNPTNELDLFLILASPEKDKLKEEFTSISNKFSQLITFKEFGDRLPNDNEHFGFKDGISQPKLRGLIDEQTPLTKREVLNQNIGVEYASSGSPLVWTGEFVFGYPTQDPNHFRTPVPTSEDTQNDLVKNGSFLVVRRLNQDVKLFYEETDRISSELQASGQFQEYNPEFLRAKFIGRYKNGSPLVRNDQANDQYENKLSNLFNYKENIPDITLFNGEVIKGCPADSQGLRCPLPSHIRKVNPRDSPTDQGASSNTMKFRILRRGIPFGSQYDFKNPANVSNNEERGLFFLCYQTSIEHQFELLMNRWVNSPINPEENKGFDMLLGNNNTAKNKKMWFEIQNKKLESKKLTAINNWIFPTGGQYFFVPSISLINKITSATN